MRDQVVTHFREHLGAEETITPTSTVEVMIWADPSDSETVILATVGMSAVPMKVGSGQSCVSSAPRVELLMYASRGDVAAASRLLGDLVRYPTEHDTFFHWSHVIRVGRPLVADSALNALYFSFPAIGRSGFATLTVGLRRVDVLWVVPISESERQVFESSGADALERLLEANDVSVADFRRT